MIDARFKRHGIVRGRDEFGLFASNDHRKVDAAIEPQQAILAAKNALALRLLVRGLSRGDMADHAAACSASPWLWTRADFDACLDNVEALTEDAEQEIAALREAIDKVLPALFDKEPRS